MTGATLVIAAAVFFFLIPSHAAVSSVSGLAIVLSNVVPLSVAGITMVLNIVLLIAGFLLCGHEFGFKTVYTSILLPLFIGFFEILLPNNGSISGDALLDVACYIFTVSIGLSVLGTYLNGMVLDYFIFGQNRKRRVCIISKEKEQQICNWILYTLKSGATIYQAKGAYDGTVRNEIITIVDKNEYQKLMQYMMKEDPAAFITVYNVSDMRYIPKTKTKIPYRDSLS